MVLFSSAWHIANSFIIFICGAIIISAIGNKINIRTKRSIIIYTWHTVFCLLYCWYALTYGGDAIGYYNRALKNQFEFDIGTSGVDFLTAIFVQGLDLSLFGTFLLFNIFGTIGLLYFDASLKNATENKQTKYKYLATLIVFLPSVSFWSSAIGKDALSFMSIGLALWASIDLNKRTLLMIVSIMLMFFVRPHIAGSMVISLSLASLFDKNSSFNKKFIMAGISIIIAVILIPFALDFAGVGKTEDTETLIEYINNRQIQNMEGGSSIDLANMSLPLQLFTYLFRPVIFEARSIFSLAASIDNLILFYLFIIGALSVFKKIKVTENANRIFMWNYSLITWFILSITTANLGIALRQKWMFTPILIYLLLSITKNKK